MPTVELSFENILLSLAVILLICNLISSLNNGRKDLRELSGADKRETEMNGIKARISTLENSMNTVKTRLDKGDEAFQRVSADTSQIMNVLNGMLMHFISGNDTDKLRLVKSELDHYKNDSK